MCYNNKILVPVIIPILLSQTLAKPQNKLQSRIVNGFSCNTTEISFFVMILSREACGGSLLTYDWVLTAAHCLVPQSVEGVASTVHSGFDMSPQLKQVRNVKEVHIHPNFVGEDFFPGNDLRYDIGFILVDEPFHQTTATHVATLPTPGFTKQCNTVMVAGIGDTSSGEVWETLPEQRPVKCVNESIIDSNTCKEEYTRYNERIRFDDTIICTHEHGKGTCIGDSGGPLICDNVVIGIVSFGPNDCEKRLLAATFTKVESYLDLINQIVKFPGITHIPVNDTSVGAKKSSYKSPSNIVQARVVNWKLMIFALFNWFVLQH